LSAFCAAGAIGCPAAARLPAIAPTAPPIAAPTGPATLPMSAPAAAPATGFEIGGTSIFSDGCWLWPVCLSDSSGINTELLFGLLIVRQPMFE
jgi:hypothetical protein